MKTVLKLRKRRTGQWVTVAGLAVMGLGLPLTAPIVSADDTVSKPLASGETSVVVPNDLESIPSTEVIVVEEDLPVSPISDETPSTLAETSPSTVSEDSVELKEELGEMNSVSDLPLTMSSEYSDAETSSEVESRDIASTIIAEKDSSGTDYIFTDVESVIEVRGIEGEAVVDRLSHDSVKYSKVATFKSGSESVGDFAVMAGENGAEALTSSTTTSVYDPERAVVKQPMADITFVIDATGSMSSYINKVSDNLSKFADYLKSNNIDFGVSIVTFKDETADSDFVTVESFGDGTTKYWSYDVDEIKRKLNEIGTFGGGDDPETPAEGLIKIIDLQTTVHGVTEYNSPATSLNSTHAKKFAFLLTDVDYKESTTKMSDVISQFQMSGIRTTVISNPWTEEVYRDLYTKTNGEFIDINKDDYSEVMIDLAKWIEENIDTDGDGLSDKWETEGIKDKNGKVILDLPAMGANSEIPDLFVQVDWMYKPITFSIQPYSDWLPFSWKEVKSGIIDLAPSQKSLNLVVQQFKKHGINLHIDAGSNSTMKYENGKAVKWRELSSGGNKVSYEKNFILGKNYEHWNEIVTQYLPKNRWNVFRHALFVENFSVYNSKTGKHEDSGTGLASAIPGQAFIVSKNTLGENPLVLNDNVSYAGTFMHELGHTLGLGHGGDDHVNNKPNHLSVMNYYFQTSGLVKKGGKEFERINYSDHELPKLDENNLVESKGIDPKGKTQEAKLGTKIYVNLEKKWFENIIQPFTPKKELKEYSLISKVGIDYNGDSKIEDKIGSSFDINQDGIHSEIRASVNEWNRLVYKGGYIGGYGVNAAENIKQLITKPVDEDEHAQDELTWEEYLKLGLLGNKGSAYLGGIYPSYLDSSSSHQSLLIDVVNPHFEESVAKVVVQSDLVGADDSEKEVTLTSSVDKLKTTSVFVPVVDKPTMGTHKVTVTLYSADGQVQTVEKDVEVKENVSINLKKGESYKLPISEDELVWSISDSDIVSLNETGDELVAVSSGRSVLTATVSGHLLEKFIINVVNNEETKVRLETRILTTEKVEYLEDSNLSIGKTREEASVDGEIIVEITDTYVNDELVSSDEREISRVEAVPKRVYKGTKLVTSIPHQASTTQTLPIYKDKEEDNKSPQGTGVIATSINTLSTAQTSDIALNDLAARVPQVPQTYLPNTGNTYGYVWEMAGVLVLTLTNVGLFTSKKKEQD